VKLKNKPIMLIAAGLLLLGIGAIMQLRGGAPQADAALVARCQAEMKTRGADADMIARCIDTAFATAMTATDANAAARSISAANNSEIGSNALAMFLIGLGLVLTVAGGLLYRKLSFNR
jgi:hypothetical protein